MLIEITIRYLLSSVRLAITQKTKDNKCWKECDEKGILAHLVGM
jgi:hypothetical protein